MTNQFRFRLCWGAALALVLLLLGAVAASAEIARGTCGTCAWVIDDDGVMTISPAGGDSGTLISRDYPNGFPWHDYRKQVKKLQFRGGTVYAGAKAGSIFAGMANMTEFDGANFDVSYCTDIGFMFYECQALEKVTGLTTWDVSRISKTQQMFYNCTALKEVDLSGWDASNCANMQYMFSGCTALERVHADPGIKVGGNMGSMFSGCVSLQPHDFEKWDTSHATGMQHMFGGCTALEGIDVSRWDVSRVTDMSRMFSYCSSLKNIDLSTWDTGNVKTMEKMFINCTGLQEANLNGLDASRCESFLSMFENCRSLKQVPADGFTARRGTMETMFLNCSALKSIDAEKWDLSGVTSMEGMLRASGLESVDLRNWDVSSVVYMQRMMGNCSELKTVNISGWDARACINMESMFYAAKKLETVIGEGMKLGRVYMSWVFQYCNNLSSIDTEKWIGVRPTNTQRMFQYCNRLETLDLSSWNFENFTYAWQMVQYCPAMKKLVISDTFAKELAQLNFPVAMYEMAHGDDIDAYYAFDAQIPSAANAAISTAPAVYVVGHKVTYDGNGGTGDVVAQVFGWSMAKKPLRDNGYTLAGSAFTGWNTAPDGTGTAYADHQMLDYDTLSGDITLYAQWAPVATITYDLNGGVLNGQRENIVFTVPLNTVITILNAPEKEGFEFQYWEGSAYYPGQTYTANEDHTFTAKWRPKPTVPKTGDTARPALYLAFAALSALALLALGRKRRVEK